MNMIYHCVKTREVFWNEVLMKCRNVTNSEREFWKQQHFSEKVRTCLTTSSHYNHKRYKNDVKVNLLFL